MSSRIKAAEALLRLKAGNLHYVQSIIPIPVTFRRSFGPIQRKTGNSPMPLLSPVPTPGSFLKSSFPPVWANCSPSGWQAM